MQTVVLLLEEGKYYITETLDPAALLADFRADRKSNDWLRRHPVAGILEIRAGVTADELTITYMAEKGLENVRGGSFSGVNINIDDLCRAVACKKCASIDHRTEDCDYAPKCARCSSAGHRTENCDWTDVSTEPTQQPETAAQVAQAVAAIGEFVWAAMNIGQKNQS